MAYEPNIAVRQGEDRRRGSELLADAKRFVSWWADGKLPGWVDRDDLMQEVLIAWNATEGRPKPYRNRAAINRMIDHLRAFNYTGQHRAGHSQPTAPEDIERNADTTEPYPDNMLSRDELSRLRSLPPRYGAILYYRFIEEETLAQVGARFGVGESRIAQIVQTALAVLRDEAPSREPSRLSKPECDVLAGAAEGESADETATRLVRSVETVKTHRKHIIAKLDARNMMHAIHLAHREKLLS